MHFCGAVRKRCLLLLFFSLVANFTWAQSETATVSGQVVDPSGLNITAAQVKLVDIDRDTSVTTTTNNTGLYTFPSVKPGRYRMEVISVGFKVVNVTGVTINVQDHLEQNFKLVVGSISESMTVTADAYNVNTTDATVSTVVDRNFAENLPMNGRSFQTLIQLTPGVVVTATNTNDSGQFSVNGQRAASNYWMVDGVSANIGIGVDFSGSAGNGLGGSVGAFSVAGGTNSLVSVDALQEFRIQTSTYAPEFGRTPGGQISIVTRSGANQFHGTLFDYFRNDTLDANDWFADRDRLPKPEERQNDFGGTLGGPILRDRTFFFLSYEGLRLRLPQVAQVGVPDLMSRQNAVSAVQPYLNAFPLPTPGAPDNTGTGIAQLMASFSDRSTLDAGSVRIDHKLSDKLSIFGRYNYSPSDIIQRGASSTSLNTVNPIDITTQTATAGATWEISPVASNDFRFNYSRAVASGSNYIDDFGGGIPLTSLPFPSSFSPQNGLFYFQILSIPLYQAGDQGKNTQRQINLVDSLSIQKGPHGVKIGVDFRRLSPIHNPPRYKQEPIFLDVPSAETGSLFESVVFSDLDSTLLLRNLGIYAQDTWRVVPRLTATYGVRWDVDFVPQSINGPDFPAATNFSLTNLSTLALAPAGTHPYNTTYGNVAPRLGLAYQVSQKGGWETVLRGGFGVFYDLATSETGNNIGVGSYPFGSLVLQCCLTGTFPLSAAATLPAPIAPPSASNPGTLDLFDPHLKLPYTLQWNVAIEQGLGPKQSISTSYVGAAGRRLLQSALLFSPTPALSEAQLVVNAGTSDYDALQAQFQRRLSHGLQGLVSYTWSHSIDTGSAGSDAVVSNVFVPSSLSAANRGPSDFDIRHTLSAGVTYNIPTLKLNGLTDAALGGWSLENIIQVRSAPPVDVSYVPDNDTFQGGVYGDVRPDLVRGQPLYIYGAQCASTFRATGDLEPGESCPGSRGLNPSAFAPPTAFPSGQGTLPRNALRGFGAGQWDFAVHRQFKFRESLKLEFRGEMFNVLNHPNFAPPLGGFGLGSGFGLSTQMLGRSFGGFGSSGAGGFSSLYQVGGPRSIQLALKLTF
jgi:hypothetical protein